MIPKFKRVIDSRGLEYIPQELLLRIRSLYISRRLNFPSDCRFGHGTYFIGGRNIEVGSGLRIGSRCRIELIKYHNGRVYNPRLVIGDHVNINDDVHIGCAYSVKIGNGVLMASKIYISDHNHGSYGPQIFDSPLISPSHRSLHGKEVIIKDNVWIGEMVSILPGTTIGECSIIGANSVVSRDIPPYTIAVGTPAKPIKRFDFARGIWLLVK